jgi:rhodanese-related sulfurtransferase
MSIKLQTEINDGVPEVHPQNLSLQISQFKAQVSLIDVRRKEEYVGELGHIEGAKLVTLGPDLDIFLQNEAKNLDQTIIFICRSGARSARSTLISRSLGFTQTYNLTGGMILWNQLSLPVKDKNIT